MNILFVPILSILISYLIYGSALTMTLITCDGIFSAIYFFGVYLSNKAKKKEIIKSTSSLYVLPALDRYIWYVICGYAFQTIYTMFWMTYSYKLAIPIVIINIPYIQNKVITKVFGWLFRIIRKKQKRFIKETIARQFVKMINMGVKTCTDHKNNVVNVKEIEYLFDNHDTAFSGVKAIIQNVVVVSVMTYLKGYSSVYHGIIKRVYNYKLSDHKIRTMDRKRVTNVLNDICLKKDWDKLLDPSFIQALIYIYYNNEFDQEDNILTIILSQFNYSLVKFFSVWTTLSLISLISIESFTKFIEFTSTQFCYWFPTLCIYAQSISFPNVTLPNIPISIVLFRINYSLYITRMIPILGPIIFYMFHFYERGFYKKGCLTDITYVGRLIGISLGLILAIKTDKYSLICFVSEFTYYIVLNPASLNLYKTIYRNIVRFLTKNQNLNSYQIAETLFYVLCCSSLSLIMDTSSKSIYTTIFSILFSLMIIYISMSNIRKVGIILLILNIGQLSNYGFFHIASNIHNYYLIMNYMYSHHLYNLCYKIKYKGEYKYLRKLAEMNKLNGNLTLEKYEKDDDDIRQPTMKEEVTENKKSFIVSKVNNPILLESFIES
jgi:hypothetical protein